MNQPDTIYALSSGIAVSAVAVVRLSGARTSAVLRALTLSRLPEARRFSVRSLYDPQSGEILDEAVVIWSPGPASFTGEDMGELHLHGSRAVVAGVLAALGRFENVRAAEPGEFTRRALLNGRMDAVEVEGLADLLEAQTERQRRQALGQLRGASSAVFEGWRERLVGLRALVEAAVDFADEEGVAAGAVSRIAGEIAALRMLFSEAVEQSVQAETVRHGVKVVLCGLPNTGKSSLLNAIARRDVALVSDIAGTTRDVIEVPISLGGMAVVLSDTAGLRRDASDLVERAGIERTWRELAGADVVIWVAASDIPESMTIPDDVRPDLVVVGKADLDDEHSIQMRNDGHVSPRLRISAREGTGIPLLLGQLQEIVSGRFPSVIDPLITTARQREALKAAMGGLDRASGYGPDSLERMAEEIRSATDAIGRLTGRVDVEEWLGAIFSRFCIGK